MASGFDPYYKWLGIPPEEQPPDHYRLLGLRRFESDPEVIEAASDQRMAHLRTYQAGQYSALSQKLLNEVAGAKICLLSPEKRAPYDESLKLAAPAAAPEVPLPAAAITLPLSAAPDEPLAPPAAWDRVFDLERLGVSDDGGGNSDALAAGGSGQGSGAHAYREVASPAMKSDRGAALAAKPGHRSSIAALAACTVLLGLVTVLAYWARVKRIDEGLPSADHSSSASRTKANRSSIPDKKGQIAARPPALVNPANGATLPNPNPPTGIVLQWQPVANASRYWARVEVPNSTKPVVDERNLDRTSLRMKLLHPVPRETCHGWRWRVRAMVNGQWTDWSEARTFDLAEPADQAAAAPMPEENPQVQPEPAEPEKAAEPAGPEKSAEPEKPIVRPPLPSEAARKKANQVFRDVYAKQYAAPKTAEGHLALANGRGKGAREGKRCQRPNLGNMR